MLQTNFVEKAKTFIFCSLHTVFFHCNIGYANVPVLRYTCCKGKGRGKGKVHPRTGHEGPEGE